MEAQRKIHKILFSVIFVLGVHFSTDAQPSFGVKGGINLNSLKLNLDFLETKNTIGMHVGVFSEIKMASQFSFIPEVQFATRKYNVNVFAYEILIGYVEVPLMLSWHPADLISFEAGPYLAAKLYTSSSKTDSQLIEEIFSKKLDAGLAAGFRIHLSKNLSVSPRYFLGLVPLADMEVRDETNQPLFYFKAYNRAVELSVGWKFD
jgi:hypothetical protein